MIPETGGTREVGFVDGLALPAHRGPRALATAACLILIAGGRLGAGERSAVTIAGAPGCEGTSGRYVAWLRGSEPGLVISSAEFPAARSVPLDERGALGEAAPGLVQPSAKPLTITGADPVWVLGLPAEVATLEGCIAFDKDRFTWEGDLVSYVRYLAGLLAAAQEIDPAVRTLTVGRRTVALEVGQADGRRVRLRGPVGAMQGLGRWSDPVRHFFLPVLVGPGEDRVLVRILRNQGEPFGSRSTEGIGWVLLAGDESVVSPTEPAFEVRLVEVGS